MARIDAVNSSTAAQLRKQVGLRPLVARYTSIALRDAATHADGDIVAVIGLTSDAGEYERVSGAWIRYGTGGGGGDVTLAALAADTGSTLSSYKSAGTGAYKRTVAAKLEDGGVSVLDFIPVAEHAAIKAGTSVYDCRAGIQAAIDYAVYVTRQKVHAPAGRYVCSGELFLGYGTQYNSVVFEGDGMRYVTGTNFGGTAIVFTHNNAPGFSFQGARGSVIRGVSIKGGMSAYLVSNNCGNYAGTMADLAATYWVDTAYPAASSSRYAPFAGVAIDPRSGTRPGVSYPDVAYPAEYVGTPTQYGKNYSSNVLIDNVEIEGFVVAVANQPCDADGNGDYTKIRRCMISYCQYGVSICNTQSRLVHFVDGFINYVHTAFVTTKHGRQSGKPSLLVESSEFGGVIQWLDMPNTSYGGAPHFISCYGEQVYRIGNAGINSSANSTVTFDSCDFGLELQNSRGAPVYVYENNGDGYAVFNGCTFSAITGAHHLAFGGLAKSYQFNGCTTYSAATALYEKFAYNATAGITCSRAGGNYDKFSVNAGVRWNLDDGSQLSVGNGIGQLKVGGGRNECVPISTRLLTPQNSVGTANPVLFMAYAIGKPGSFTTSGRDVTWDTGYAGLEWAIKQRGLGVGDIVWDDYSGVTFYVRSRADGVITMRAMTGFDGAGNLLVAMSTMGAFYCQRSSVYSPQYPIYASSTAGAGFTAMHNGGSTFNKGGIVVDDYLAWQSNSLNHGSEDGSKITAIDEAAKTMSIVYGAARANTDRTLVLFMRPEAPNSP